MTERYLPAWATLQEASDWLKAETGQDWPMPRIVGAGADAAVFLDCPDDAPAEVVDGLFLGRREGFMAPLVFHGDSARLAIVRDGGTLSLTRRPDGVPVTLTPPARFDAEDVRLSAESLRAIVFDGSVSAGGPLRDNAVVRHKLRAQARDTLSPVIEATQRQCKDPRDTAEVWTRLEAQANDGIPPLLAATPDGVKYTKNGKDAYLTRDALDKRIRRQKG